MNSPAKVKCPSCEKIGAWFSTPFGPFCSKRCRLVDLGKWFNQENAITEPLRPDHFKEYESLESGQRLDEPENDET